MLRAGKAAGHRDVDRQIPGVPQQAFRLPQPGEQQRLPEGVPRLAAQHPAQVGGADVEPPRQVLQRQLLGVPLADEA